MLAGEASSAGSCRIGVAFRLDSRAGATNNIVDFSPFQKAYEGTVHPFLDRATELVPGFQLLPMEISLRELGDIFALIAVLAAFHLAVDELPDGVRE
ncbi:MAG: hypothetical protein V3V08_03815 [Nannocystaceae bacterium]